MSDRPSNPSESNSAAPSAGLETPLHLDFLWKTHQHFQETIRFLDGKAIALLLVTVGLIVTLALPATSEANTPLWRKIAMTALIFDGIGLVAALLAILPRMSSTGQPNVLSPKDMTTHYQEAGVLSRTIFSSTLERLGEQLSVQIVTISRILNRKSSYTTAALCCLTVAVFLGVPTLISGQVIKKEASGAGSPAAASTARASELRRVTVAQFGDLLLYLPLYIAKHEGVFQKYGLDVQIVSTGGDDKTYAAIAAGQADFGIADPTFVAIASARGQEGRVLGLLVDGMPNYAVALSQRPALTSLGELKTLTIASVPAPSTSYALTKSLYDKAGVVPQIRQVSPSALLATVQAKQADLAVLIEPWVSAVVRQGGSVVIPYPDYFRHFALTGVMTSKTYLEQNPQVMKQFMAALREAIAIFYSDSARSLKTARIVFPTEDERDLAAGIDRHQRDRIHPEELAVALGSWNAAIQLRVQSGDLPASKTSYQELITSQSK